MHYNLEVVEDVTLFLKMLVCGKSQLFKQLTGDVMYCSCAPGGSLENVINQFSRDLSFKVCDNRFKIYNYVG